MDSKLTAHGRGGQAATEHRGDGGTARDGNGRALEEHDVEVGCGWGRVNWGEMSGLEREGEAGLGGLRI